VLIYFAIQGCPDFLTLEIDEEYTGKEHIIQTTLERLFLRDGSPAPHLIFVRVGKHSPAHKLAWTAHRNKGNGVKKVTAKQILALLAPKKP